MESVAFNVKDIFCFLDFWKVLLQINTMNTEVDEKELFLFFSLHNCFHGIFVNKSPPHLPLPPFFFILTGDACKTVKYEQFLFTHE